MPALYSNRLRMNQLASKNSARLDACSNEDGKANVAKMNIEVQPAAPWNDSDDGDDKIQDDRSEHKISVGPRKEKRERPEY